MVPVEILGDQPSCIPPQHARRLRDTSADLEIDSLAHQHDMPRLDASGCLLVGEHLRHLLAIRAHVGRRRFQEAAKDTDFVARVADPRRAPNVAIKMVEFDAHQLNAF